MPHASQENPMDRRMCNLRCCRHIALIITLKSITKHFLAFFPVSKLARCYYGAVIIQLTQTIALFHFFISKTNGVSPVDSLTTARVDTNEILFSKFGKFSSLSIFLKFLLKIFFTHLINLTNY